ncbi:Scd6-like Sm domain-containing protein [Vararia minispora EC-137]|uniref:Scd6-like Sm domain-containing protein n=1 Tax=Vararia minispora EC-137 TaxID=1314806 RepID=A0ACB8Q7I5_9AGAM|nr:Scd6-like Sm domain-containing protein [Vararia minispora EC-137]
MATFIGKPISLVSHSDVRYRGILAGIDPNASTIQLSNVYSMGTESRRPPAQFIPPVPDPYEYIIFRASEVKDLSVDEQVAPRSSVHDDPAVLGASARPQGVAPSYVPYGAAQPYGSAPPPAAPAPAPVGRGPPASAPTAPRTGSGSVQTADASLETVGRALGDLRQQNGVAKLRVPATDFDFASANARFDKQALSPGAHGGAGVNGGADGSGGKEEGEVEEPRAYDPQKSFFDSLSSGSNASGGGGGGGGGGGRGRGRGRGGGRNRREEERERNVATFGEPGGVGLMGPGAYVGGWGGYGRRGGGRGRRGPGQAAGARS